MVGIYNMRRKNAIGHSIKTLGVQCQNGLEFESRHLKT